MVPTVQVLGVPMVRQELEVLVLAVLVVLTVRVLRVRVLRVLRVCPRASLRAPASRPACGRGRSRDRSRRRGRRQAPGSATASPGHRPAVRSGTGHAPAGASDPDRCASPSARRARRSREMPRHRRVSRPPSPAGGTPPRRCRMRREAGERKAKERTPRRDRKRLRDSGRASPGLADGPCDARARAVDGLVDGYRSERQKHHLVS